MLPCHLRVYPGRVQVVPSHSPPAALQSSALLGPEELLAMLAGLASLDVLGALGSLGSLGSLGELAELCAEVADPASDAWAIDIVVKAGTA